MKFLYTNRGPLPYAAQRTNLINLFRGNGRLAFSRRFVKNSGEIDDNSIVYTFEKIENSKEIARQIHWGCCGWDAGGHQIWRLIELVDKFLEKTNSTETFQIREQL